MNTRKSHQDTMRILTLLALTCLTLASMMA
jgi:hypothetical protein